MNVNRYIFQSPYNSQVQVGRLDSSTSSNENKEVSNNIQATKKETISFENIKTQKDIETAPEQNPDALLDLYA